MNNKIKTILMILSITFILSSCGEKISNTSNIEKKHNLIKNSSSEMTNNIKKLDKEGKKIVIEYFSSKDKIKKQQLKKQISEHMISIQNEIWKVSWDTIEEKNKKIQKITKLIKLYKSLGF